MTIYMKVTNDEYELPLAVADSAASLANRLGINPCVIYRSLNSKNGIYVKVEIDDWEDDDV